MADRKKTSITGTVRKILEPYKGSSSNGEYIKAEFVIDAYQDTEYPKPVVLTAWTKLAPVVENLQIGESVTVHYNPEAREYNDRWYSTLKAWKIDKNATPPPTQPDPIPEEPQSGEDLPF